MTDPLKPKKYVHGPYAVMGTTITCEICGHQHRGSHCVVCQQATENGNWVDHVLKYSKEKNDDTSDT